jgi:hypothetical protein
MNHQAGPMRASLRLSPLAVFAFVLVSLTTFCSAATFYVDPATGSNRNDGSALRPWRTLQEVIDSNKIETRQPATFPYTWGQPLVTKNAGAPVKAGDTILLRSGYHGVVTFSRMYNTDWITVAAQQGQSPGMGSILLQAVCKWRIKGLTVSPELAGSTQKITLIDVQSHNWSGPTREVEVEACLAYTALNVDAWDTVTWKARSCNGISVTGRQVTIRGNMVRNVDFGIQVSEDSVLVEGNTVDRFDGDGLRGVANDLTFRGNLVKNCIVANSANHDDGFQSWSVGDSGVGTGTVYRVKLIGNTIIDYTDPNLPLKGSLQGIGCFDGMFEDWDIVNNVIITDHWHGISLYGAINCRVINNTVVDINTVSPGPPWIMVTAHKNGTPPRNCTIRNNLTTSLSIDSGAGMVTDHNIILNNPSAFFVDYPAFNLRLKAGCAAIDSGSSLLAPATDIAGVVRPVGRAVDVGAYEYTTQAVRPGSVTRQTGLSVLRCQALPGGRLRISVGSGVHTGDADVRIRDLSGRTVRTFAAMSGMDSVVDVRGLAAGVYGVLLRIADTESASAIQLIQ